MNKLQQSRAIQRFAESVDVSALRLFLESSEIPKFQILFGLMSDPAYKRCSFQTLLRKSRISIAEIQSIYTDGMRHLGMLRMMNALPDIMADVVEDARTTTQVCPRCDGFGFVPSGEGLTRECPVCHGAMSVRKMGDKHARDLLFETAKLTRQTGSTIAIQNNVQIGDARIETMLKRTREIVLATPSNGSINLDKPNVQVIEDKE